MNADKYPTRSAIELWENYYNTRRNAYTLFTSNGPEWRNLRTASNPILMKPEYILSYFKIHNKIINEMIDWLNSKFENEQKSIELDEFNKTLQYLAFECKFY